MLLRGRCNRACPTYRCYQALAQVCIWQLESHKQLWQLETLCYLINSPRIVRLQFKSSAIRSADCALDRPLRVRYILLRIQSVFGRSETWFMIPWPSLEENLGSDGIFTMSCRSRSYYSGFTKTRIHMCLHIEFIESSQASSPPCLFFSRGLCSLMREGSRGGSLYFSCSCW